MLCGGAGGGSRSAGALLLPGGAVGGGGGLGDMLRHLALRLLGLWVKYGSEQKYSLLKRGQEPGGICLRGKEKRKRSSVYTAVSEK